MPWASADPLVDTAFGRVNSVGGAAGVGEGEIEAIGHLVPEIRRGETLKTAEVSALSRAS